MPGQSRRLHCGPNGHLLPFATTFRIIVLPEITVETTIGMLPAIDNEAAGHTIRCMAISSVRLVIRNLLQYIFQILVQLFIRRIRIHNRKRQGGARAALVQIGFRQGVQNVAEEAYVAIQTP